MKKLLSIIAINFLLSGNAYSKIVEFSNCYWTAILNINNEWHPWPTKNWKDFQSSIFLSQNMKESGKFPNGAILDVIISINPKNNSIIVRTIYSDEYTQKKVKDKNSSEFWLVDNKKTNFAKEKYLTEYYKVKSFVGGVVEGVSKYGTPIRVEIKNAKYETGRYRHKCAKGGYNKSSYLDYWWAVILIIAITFFIFTQSGKRLKQIRRK